MSTTTMFKKPTKKQFLIRRIVISALTTIAVLIIVTVSILFMLGYRLDSGNGKLSQGALLQFNSTPDGAQVYVDDTYIGAQTSTKQTVVAGTHSVKFVKNGYNDWNRTLQLDSGTLTWLDYARLVPTNRPIEAVSYYQTLADMKFSTDLKWALGQENSAVPVFRLVDLRANEIKNTFLTLPTTLYSATETPEAAHAFTMHRWSSGARYSILKHTFGANKTEWILFDTQEPARSINITRTLNVDLSDVRFASDSGMTLYGLAVDGTLRKLDLSGETISRGLVTHVKSFMVYEDSSTVSYVGLDPVNTTQSVVGIYKDGDTAARVLRTVKGADVPLTIAVARYYGDDYVAIAEGAKVDVLIGTVPGASQEVTTLRPFAKLTLDAPVTALSFSPKGEYMLAQAGAQFASYEIEHQRNSNQTITVDEGQAAPQLVWLDAAHVWNNANGSVTMRDFNGLNVHAIMKAEPGYSASLSQNGRFFYSIGKAEDGRYQLQRVKMILN